MEETFRLDFICTEGKSPEVERQIAAQGGDVTETKPFKPPPDLVDLYADPEFEPMTVLVAAVATSLGLKLIREMIRDIRGRELLTLTVKDGEVVARTVPLGNATEVIVIGENGEQHFSVDQSTKIEEALISLLKV